MTVKDLYKSPIDRTLNPAVSAEDFTIETITTEIDEYVFTDEIINGLYNILNAVKNQQVSHNGIWINGYFGSGKSHFLKYLGYCVSPAYRDKALDRLVAAVQERDPLIDSNSKSEVTIDDIKNLSTWVRSATIDMILFNIGAVHGGEDDKSVFTRIFWNQFNRFRGYNSFNLALAQNFEKVLDSAGKLEEFKHIISEQYGFDWKEHANMLANIYLDTVLEIGKQLLPDLTIDSVRKVILEDRQDVSPEAFCMELKEHISKKNDKNYRLLFFVDEVSQFVSERKPLLLQMQEIVTGLHNHCKDQVWVACTAQQDLSQLLTNMEINQTSADYGKIMGRFQVRVSLRGDQTEYITQKRLLDKTPEGVDELHSIWEQKHQAIDDQFTLPSSFYSFRGEEDFINYYPFVPYQFRLIMKVLDSFGALRYIDSQSRGNERSIIKITHSTAVRNMNEEVGKFISFDRFYNSMFEDSLMASGQRAISNANLMIKEYEDPSFAQRVVNVLFMICNLTAAEKLLFPATKEHIVTLLMEDVDTSKAELINRVEKTLAFLDQKHIIRTEKFTDGNKDIYCFQSEDEIDATREIASTQMDNTTMANHYATIFRKHFKCSDTSNREYYCSRNFSIGWTILGRNFYTNNADIVVNFDISTQNDNNLLFNINEQNRLTFNIGSELEKDRLLRDDFFWYCQVQTFAAKPIGSETRRKTMESISQRAKNLYDTRIVPKINAILNRCQILSGNTAMNVSGDGQVRYKNALAQHFDNIYPYAKLSASTSLPHNVNDLAKSILRPIQPNEYHAMNSLSEIETQIDQYLSSSSYSILYVNEVVNHFEGRPYGWSDIVTIYHLNELRRRGRWSFKYNNDANIDNKTISANIYSQQKKFTVVPATIISQSLINKFVEAWKSVFNTNSSPSSYDSNELFRQSKTTEENEKHISLGSIRRQYEAIRNEIGHLPFASPITEAIDLIDRWAAERDHKTFFEMVVNEQEKGKEIFDKCKVVISFKNDQLQNYLDIRAFVTENKDNFSFIGEEEKVKELSSIMSDACPMQNMRQYCKLQRELAALLGRIRDEKREAIKSEYLAVFEELRQLCEENNVAYTINERAVIAKMTESSNIFVLDKNVDTQEYRATQTTDIMSRRPVGPNHDNGSSKTPPAPKRTIRMVTLKTWSQKALNSEKAVDEYLAALKAQLMQTVNDRKDNEDIMVK